MSMYIAYMSSIVIQSNIVHLYLVRRDMKFRRIDVSIYVGKLKKSIRIAQSKHCLCYIKRDHFDGISL